MKKPKKEYLDLEEGEVIELFLRRHPFTNIRWLSISVVIYFIPSILYYFPWDELGSIIGVLAFQTYGAFAIIWYFLGTAYGVENFLKWYYNIYLVTNKRLIDIDFNGVFHTRVSETNLRQVQDVTYGSNGLWPSLFQYGDVFVQTASSRPEFDFSGVPKPHQVYDKITDLVTASKRRQARDESGNIN